MCKPLEIEKDIFYVGVNDRTKHLFESLWPLPNGVSYNSYLIVDEKVALIDTVDICYSDVFFRKITSLLGDRPIDYLVVNHMEPDHSGSIGLLVNKYPDISIVGNKRTIEMLKGYYGVTNNLVEILDLDTLNLGKYNLKFYLTPMVHWPETMMTYLQEMNTLFSGDAFGTFGAIDGGVLDSQTRIEKYWDEMIRYYSNIVGKFGSPVQTALKKLSGVEIDMICSTHGPVWTKNGRINEVISLYDKLSKYDADSGLVIVYGSMYGNTAELADTIAVSASQNGVKDIVIHNVSKSHESDIIRDVFKYKGLIIGSPTYNNKLYPAVESVVTSLQNRNLKNRYFGYFGGFSWSDASERLLKSFAEEMNFEVVASPVVIKQGMLDEVYEKANNLGMMMAKKLNSDNSK
ncbi:MAG TPA: FprA family A-type flavoprotein [Fermentimonas caenicola]|jgi:anaerobic nitric oxide reductase flavorubredoxin|uniref:Flavodoxin-like domain-containing protein n=1 Tax=Fermentimonas caenicola TaxID=1562970 RepID=A0A098C1J2_9BACT|nr:MULTISPECIES: FprA family A-type flavoprotein [Lascolabacillus]MBP6175704.1 FprA family A-type flavoprotein [Fermentimonas sp.]MDI9625737.1 FprA family A-type flavoprotein [Bacteroidota bacterium]TAH60880.1 MAG: FprA family A-type flavoprotein [Fermentimonas caenicola]MBP6196132.1 FprA family A-type flavoprotein [Fermentimonas sp.]MBP7104969.1 FprA family A-type flavoprotein [Fermentimonas sp.]